jgi:hypothetical protein
MLNQR